jgi:N-acetylneuraminic acid mutarotase
MPEPTSEAGAVLLNERIYIIGGLDANEEVTDEVKVYDIQSNSWSAATPLPIPLDHSGVAVHDGRIYLVGGFLEKKVPTDKLFIYDPQSDKWEEGEPLPEPRGTLTANFIDGILYAVGVLTPPILQYLLMKPIIPKLIYGPKKPQCQPRDIISHPK